MIIRIGTRGSRLALAMTGSVADALEQRPSMIARLGAHILIERREPGPFPQGFGGASGQEFGAAARDELTEVFHAGDVAPDQGLKIVAQESPVPTGCPKRSHAARVGPMPQRGFVDAQQRRSFPKRQPWSCARFRHKQT